jgi:hypothetical protein
MASKPVNRPALLLACGEGDCGRPTAAATSTKGSGHLVGGQKDLRPRPNVHLPLTSIAKSTLGGGGRRWSGLGQVQAQLAATRPRHHPRPLVGRNRPFPALLYVARKNGEKHTLQAHISNVPCVLEVCCKHFIRCCKSRSECCICCNDCTHMLQEYVSNVSLFF